MGEVFQRGKVSKGLEENVLHKGETFYGVKEENELIG